MARTGRRGTDNVTLRVEDDLWDAFGQVAGERRRSEELRNYIRWRLREPGVTLPRRPRVAIPVGDKATT